MARGTVQSSILPSSLDAISEFT